MRTIAVLFVLAVALSGCSKTEAPEPEVSATTVLQQDVNDFCQDVQDALENKDNLDPEDQAEHLEELQELAQELGVGTRDDMYAADALTKCSKELQDEINK